MAPFWHLFKTSSEKMRQTYDARRKQTLSPAELNASNMLSPTSTARITTLLREAEAFVKPLTAAQSSIIAWDRYTDAGLSTLKAFLTIPLPRTTFDANDKITGPLITVGEGIDLDTFAGASHDMHVRIQREVLNQTEEWLEKLQLIKAKAKQLDEIRLHLDRKRRELFNIEVKLQRYEAEGRPNEKLAQQKLSEEGKVNRLKIKFDDAEVEVYASLIKLFGDAAALRQCAASGIEIMQNCYNTCRNAFEVPPTHALAYVANLPVPNAPLRQSLPPSLLPSPRPSPRQSLPPSVLPLPRPSPSEAGASSVSGQAPMTSYQDDGGLSLPIPPTWSVNSNALFQLPTTNTVLNPRYAASTTDSKESGRSEESSSDAESLPAQTIQKKAGKKKKSKLSQPAVQEPGQAPAVAQQ